MKYTTFLITLFCASFLFGQIPNGYYNTAEGYVGTVLKTKLNAIIKDHVEFPYTSNSTDVWDILKETDKDPNNPTLFYCIPNGLQTEQKNIMAEMVGIENMFGQNPTVTWEISKAQEQMFML